MHPFDDNTITNKKGKRKLVQYNKEIEGRTHPHYITIETEGYGQTHMEGFTLTGYINPQDAEEIVIAYNTLNGL